MNDSDTCRDDDQLGGDAPKRADFTLDLAVPIPISFYDSSLQGWQLDRDDIKVWNTGKDGAKQDAWQQRRVELGGVDNERDGQADIDGNTEVGFPCRVIRRHGFLPVWDGVENKVAGDGRGHDNKRIANEGA